MELLLYFAFICMGRLVVTVVTLGRWRGENLLRKESRIYSAAGALWFRRDGKGIVTTTGQLFVGVIFYSLLTQIPVVLNGVFSG